MIDLVGVIHQAPIMTAGTSIPMRRQAQASEIAEAMYFLVSPAASYVTGTCLDVNGGLVIR